MAGNRKVTLKIISITTLVASEKQKPITRYFLSLPLFLTGTKSIDCNNHIMVQVINIGTNIDAQYWKKALI